MMEKPLKGPLPIVRDHMDSFVSTLRPDAEIMEAISFLLEKRVTGAPVIDDSGKLVGMLTERDCLTLVAEGAEAKRPQGTVADFMTTDVITISPEVDVYYVAGLFLEHSFRRLPIIEEGKVVGAITRFDILRVMHFNLR
jgi:CBS domain-containing protein